MSIVSSGIQSIQNAQVRADAASDRLVKQGVSAEDLVQLDVAKQESEIGAKLIKAGDDMAGQLLDVLA